MHINRNMRNLDNVIRQIETGKRIQRPSDDPIIASRALMFRTSVHENLQFQRNVDQGIAWMNVTETTFNNINKELLFEMRNLAVQGANTPNNLEPMMAIIRQMESLFEQIGHEVNQTFGGNFLFSGFRTDEPPVFTADNNRSFVITQHFNVNDISRESSFQRLIVPNRLGIYEPVTHEINVLKLAYTGLDTIPHIPGFTVVERSITDDDAYLPPAPPSPLVPPAQAVIHFVRETGELVMHNETAANFPREGVSVTFQKTGFRQGDINPTVYFTGREIVNTGIGHIPPGTQLVYNITQYFSRSSAIGPAVAGMYTFDLAFPPYADRNNHANLLDSLPTGADIVGNQVLIPARFFDLNRNVSATYAVALDSPILPATGAPTNLPARHIKEDPRVQGVELVRAIGVNGIALPLDQIELNGSFDMNNQEIQYEFASRTLITVNSLAKNILTDKMYADFRRFFQFANSLVISDEDDLIRHFTTLGYEPEVVQREVYEQLNRERQIARDALYQQFNNMLFLVDRHVDNSTREQTQLGARMVRMELVQNRLEQDEVSYTLLTSDNEDTDIIRATIDRFSAEALFMASLRANTGIIQMSIANFLR